MPADGPAARSGGRGGARPADASPTEGPWILASLPPDDDPRWGHIVDAATKWLAFVLGLHGSSASVHELILQLRDNPEMKATLPVVGEPIPRTEGLQARIREAVGERRRSSARMKTAIANACMEWVADQPNAETYLFLLENRPELTGEVWDRVNRSRSRVAISAGDVRPSAPSPDHAGSAAPTDSPVANIVLAENPKRVLEFLADSHACRPRTYIADNLPAHRGSVGLWVNELLEHDLVVDRGRQLGIAITDRGRAWLEHAEALGRPGQTPDN